MYRRRSGSLMHMSDRGEHMQHNVSRSKVGAKHTVNNIKINSHSHLQNRCIIVTQVQSVRGRLSPVLTGCAVCTVKQPSQRCSAHLAAFSASAAPAAPSCTPSFLQIATKVGAHMLRLELNLLVKARRVPHRHVGYGCRVASPHKH